MQSIFSGEITPLASLLRPYTLEDIVGQSHLVDTGKPLRRFIEAGKIPSMIFWGPPGCGKTSLARIISQSLHADFYHLSGVLSKKEDVVKIIQKAQINFSEGQQTLLFLDEIHRWTKSQQDVLLPWIEKGIVTLIGATTENPSFTVVNALLSRCQVYILQPISLEDIEKFLQKNVATIQEKYPKIIFPKMIHGENGDIALFTFFAQLGSGDLRHTLNILETSCMLQAEGELSMENILASGGKMLHYDRNGEEHYNLISAVHKSLRDSDGDAAAYWITRMLAAGEDPRYIARRMINFASEDIFDTHAIVLVNSVYDICEKVGIPDCELPLLNAAYYLADAPKNNSIYMAQKAIHADIQQFGNLPVPMHIRNAPTALMKSAGYGKGYQYAHDLPEKKSNQTHLPKELLNRIYRNM